MGRLMWRWSEGEEARIKARPEYRGAKTNTRLETQDSKPAPSIRDTRQ